MSLWGLLSAPSKYLSSLWRGVGQPAKVPCIAPSEQTKLAENAPKMPSQVFAVTETYLASNAFALKNNKHRKQILAVFSNIDEASEYARQHVHRLELRAVDQHGLVHHIGKYQGPAELSDPGDGTLALELDWYNKFKVVIEKHKVFDDVDAAPDQTPVSWIPYCPPLRSAVEVEKMIREAVEPSSDERKERDHRPEK